MNKAIYTEKKSDLQLSFEFFPPKSPLMENKFWRAVGRLEALNPDFFTVTYGALGSGQKQSLLTVKNLCAETNVPVAAHLTCVGATRRDLDNTINRFKSYGVSGIVALRGDGDDPRSVYHPPMDGYQSVPELVNQLNKDKDISISVAAYPETHPQATSAQSDIEHLKRKLDAGADRALTQYFFDIDQFLRFRDLAVSAGIDKPIIPGILPIHSYERVVKFSKACGATVPMEFAKQYDQYKDDPEATYALSVEQSASMCIKLMAEGVNQFHFYTLNITDLSYVVCCELLSISQANRIKNIAAA